MATPPLRTELADTYPNPSNAVMRAGIGKFWDYVTTLLGGDGTPATARAALGAGDATKAAIQAQTYDAFTTTGSAGTLAVATSPAYGALATNQRMQLTFNVASTGTDTLNRDSTGAILLKQYDSTGAKVAAVFKSGQKADVVYDGTHYVLLDSLPIFPVSLQTQTGKTGASLVSGGTAGSESWGSGLSYETAVASTSGTAIDFTGIPTWAKTVHFLFAGVSGSGTSPLIIQIGPSAAVETSTYIGSSGYIQDGSVSKTVAFTTGFNVAGDELGIAANAISGVLTIRNISGNTWVATGSLGFANGVPIMLGGYKSLANVLSRGRFTFANGTDTFDAGTVNVAWE